MVGASTTELESLKELIKFDHIYYKAPVESSVAVAPHDEKMVVVSLPDTAQVQEAPMEVAANSSVTTTTTTTTEQADTEVDIMKFMDADIIESLSELLDIDALVAGENNASTDKPTVVVTEPPQEKPSTTTQSLSIVSVTSKDSSSPKTTTNTVSKRGKKRKAPEVIDFDQHMLSSSFLTVPGNTSPSMHSSSCPSPLSLSESGYSSEDLLTSSPESTVSALGDDLWEESFTELFPSLL